MSYALDRYVLMLRATLNSKLILLNLKYLANCAFVKAVCIALEVQCFPNTTRHCMKLFFAISLKRALYCYLQRINWHSKYMHP
jgi:hypothetical protein